MKVEVTNKKKLNNLKTKKALVSTPKARTASLESTVSMFEKATVISSPQSEILALELVAAASAAASTLPNPSQAQSELLQQLRQHETITETQKNGDGNNIRSVQRNLFTSKRLNIFSASEVTGELTDERPTLWDIDFVNQLSTVTNQMPRNGFEEMIQWTQQGKLWQYPIDNEAGLEEEASVPFHEHIFLEKHLQEGFPRQGPVRHFMELVVAGLSKNPHLTVQQKKDHIFWFRDYFCQKEEILKEDDVYLN
uniref:Small ribosomal subunit protein mS31 n=1 Tax=Neogobius melanostomus TaxID=47308 RepID=A0A8C6SDG9_9GOBI